MLIIKSKNRQLTYFSNDSASVQELNLSTSEDSEINFFNPVPELKVSESPYTNNKKYFSGSNFLPAESTAHKRNKGSAYSVETDVATCVDNFTIKSSNKNYGDENKLENKSKGLQILDLIQRRRRRD